MMRRVLLAGGLTAVVGLGGPSGCATMSPTAGGPVQPPKVELQRVEVAHYWPFYLDTKERRGSPLDLAFVFGVENPNDTVLTLEELRFTIAFEPGFEVNTVSVYENMSIPPRTTNQLRVHAAFDAYTTLLSLLVTGGFRLQQAGVKAPDQLKEWWEKVPDFGFQIAVTNGAALFRNSGGTESLAYFQGTFPKK
ncbi:MAG TPA: hypothetical protein VFV36_06675 [Candidatus Methylomirabilis sp.]|nr:hypothetical protein [Candidatus Methylomirabilis sp.]